MIEIPFNDTPDGLILQNAITIAKQRQYIEKLESENARLRIALRRVMDNLGVPEPGYPYPVAHAYDLAKEALSSVKPERGEGS